jgi:hypothetical protein
VFRSELLEPFLLIEDPKGSKNPWGLGYQGVFPEKQPWELSQGCFLAV